MSLNTINRLELVFAKQNLSFEVGIIYFNITKKNSFKTALYLCRKSNLVYYTRKTIFQRISLATVV